MSSSKPVVLSSEDWNTSSVKYMPPKVNERGGKSINMISTQTNRSLHVTTPMMMTWGITDFIDDKGESDGKYSMSLNFPNDDYRKPTTDNFLKKLKDFENQILDDAVKNSELWWGESMSREVCKHTFFPFLKYSKNKDTKKIDPTKPPSIRAKVPNYGGKWGVEIYDTRDNLIFPSEKEQHLSPVDFVPKLSQVACVLQCGGIWIGGKGWGLTWKLIQCVVKPREVVSVYGRCHIKLSDDDRGAIETQTIRDDAEASEEEDDAVTETVFSAKSTVQSATAADDSDDEQQSAPAPAAPADDDEVEVAPVIKKKIVKKVVEEETSTIKKKVVVKKKVAAPSAEANA
jgi:hypothetical protein